MFRLSMKWSLLLCGALGLVGPASAQAVFSEKTKDLGAAARGAILNHTVRITNRHAAEMHVAGLRTSCGVCSSASMDKATLAPGESADLQIRIDTNKFVGQRSFTVYVTFDLDCLDPSVAPGVSNIEPAVTGWNMDEVTRILRALRGCDVIGGDVVCLMPTKDQPNHITAMVAGAIMYELVGLIAETADRWVPKRKPRT